MNINKFAKILLPITCALNACMEDEQILREQPQEPAIFAEHHSTNIADTIFDVFENTGAPDKICILGNENAATSERGGFTIDMYKNGNELSFAITTPSEGENRIITQELMLQLPNGEEFTQEFEMQDITLFPTNTIFEETREGYSATIYSYLTSVGMGVISFQDNSFIQDFERQPNHGGPVRVTRNETSQSDYWWCIQKGN